MNRFRTRTPAVGLALGAVAAAVALTGCSAGQVSQTATQHPAINGTEITRGDIDLRNIHLRAPQTSDFVRPGSEVELLFVAVNGSDATPDRLVEVTSEVGDVELVGDLRLPAGGTLIVGTPDGQPSPLDATERADTAEAQVTLKQPITNGLNYSFTFTFERAGDLEIQVPISAGDTARRPVEGAPAEGGAHSGGGH